VAKGNDGNYLQHSVEVSAAVHLAAKHPERRLHIALAHGMAPLETCGELPDGQARKKFQRALRTAQKASKANESAIVSAYRATKASLDHYPNTGELLRRAIGPDRLSGGITELDPQKHVQLQDAWSGSRVKPVGSSWRAAVSPGGVLTSPASLDAPWLFTMDPMTYREDGDADDNNLYRADLARLSAALTRFVESGQPGVAAFFVYAVKPKVRPSFWAFVDELAGRVDDLASRQTGTTVASCWLTHQGGNRNLAGLLCSAFALPTDWLPAGLNPGR
jgi:hypothetical protein